MQVPNTPLHAWRKVQAGCRCARRDASAGASSQAGGSMQREANRSTAGLHTAHQDGYADAQPKDGEPHCSCHLFPGHPDAVPSLAPRQHAPQHVLRERQQMALLTPAGGIRMGGTLICRTLHSDAYLSMHACEALLAVIRHAMSMFQSKSKHWEGCSTWMTRTRQG